jgi:hypothetical protein
LAITLSEIRVEFVGEGAGAGELTWGQMGIWRTCRRTGRTMNIIVKTPLPEGAPLTEMAGLLRFLVSRHPALRTRLRFADGPSGERHPWQVVAGSGEVPLQVADIGDGEDPAVVAEEQLASPYWLTWFDYENEFPIRMGVVRRSGMVVYMVMGFSHVLVDGNGLGILLGDLEHLDRSTGEATAPPTGLNPLELARIQGSPAGRRQSERSIEYWAAQLSRLPAWRYPETARPREPRFAELVVYSPAMELGIRAVAARIGVDSTSVLLAAYSVAAAGVFGRNPGVVQLAISNRFRPGLADIVSQVSQHVICVIDTADAAFDEVVVRAQKAARSAAFYGYYDPLDCARLLDETDARRGEPLDISWALNDRRAMFKPTDSDGDVPVEGDMADVLPRTKLYWDRTQPTFDGALFLQVDSSPVEADRQALVEGLPAVFMEVWTDTHLFALDQVEAFVRHMEAVVVEAASAAGAKASNRAI